MKFKFLSICSLILIFTISLSAQQKTKTSAEFINQIDKQIPEWLNEFNVPGAALALVEDGKIVHIKGYGFSDINNNKRVTIETGFNIGSISKTVAAWGVMKLVEQGKLDIDKPIKNYLTRWELPSSEFDENKVTIRRLLSHTAGLSLHGYPGFSPDQKLPSVVESLSGKTNGAGDVQLIMEPGTKWKYSGGGYTICQLIIEEVTGMSFQDYMDKEIVAPMGMANSSYNISKKILANSSLEHNMFSEEIPFEYFTAQAAAGFHTSIEDFSKFLLASLVKSESGKSLLRAKTIKEMQTPADASNGNYGLGYGITENNGPKVVGHGGANTGWHATLKLVPEIGSGFIMFTNGASGANVYRQAYGEWINWQSGEEKKNRFKKSITAALVKPLIDEGVDAAVKMYKSIKENGRDQYYFHEGMINGLGYELMAKNKLDEAIAVFKLNVEEYPESSNVYDSLAEAYMNKGEYEKSIKYYKKSLELDPANTNAETQIKKMQSK